MLYLFEPESAKLRKSSFMPPVISILSSFGADWIFSPHVAAILAPEWATWFHTFVFHSSLCGWLKLYCIDLGRWVLLHTVPCIWGFRRCYFLNSHIITYLRLRVWTEHGSIFIQLTRARSQSCKKATATESAASILCSPFVCGHFCKMLFNCGGGWDNSAGC